MHRSVFPPSWRSEIALCAASAQANDKLLEETVEFTGTVLFLQSHVPALVIGVVRDGKTAVFGFGETSDGSSKPPDRHTMLRVGSLTKAFTGQVLASLVADGTVKFTDRLQDRIGWNVTILSRDGHQITLIDLVTHSSGLPREVERRPGPPDDPFSTLTPEAYRKALASDPLVFAPGTGAIYSNFGFDVLSAALSHAAGKPYDAAAQGARPRPDRPERHGARAASGRSRSSPPGSQFRWQAAARREDAADRWRAPAEFIRLLKTSYAGCLGTSIVLRRKRRRFGSSITQRIFSAMASIRLYGFDESGHMDALGPGWVIMEPHGDLPLILQKAGGLQGIFCYTAFAPTRRIGAFVAINKFDFGAAMAMAGVVNHLIGELAPR